MTDLLEAKIADLTDSVGASKLLSCSIDQVRQYVKTDRLRCLMFDENGTLIEREPGASTRGKDLLFLRSDLVALPRRKPGRPSLKDEVNV